MEREHDQSSTYHDSFDGGEPPEFIQQIPEIVKLIMASLFVAFILHNFFKEKKKRSPTTSSSSRSNGSSSRVMLHDTTTASGGDGAGYILGSGDASLEEEEDGKSDESIIISVSLPETKSVEAAKAKKKKTVKQPAKSASAIRNYDKLICEKTPPPTTTNDDDVDPTTTDASTNSSSEQDTASNRPPPPETETQQPPSPPPIQLHSQAKHPGLTAYYNWHATITSLYRIYAIPSRNILTNNNNNTTFHPAILPMHPSSERGNIAINITVVNQTRYESIQVYWIDYEGNEVYKGHVPRGGSWFQTTYIGHPWTFRVVSDDDGSSNDNGGEESVLLKYVPFRIVPTVIGAETTTTSSRERKVSPNNNPVGTQMFTLRDVPQGYVTRNEGYEPVCVVDDEILWEPPLLLATYGGGERNMSLFTVPEMQMAIEWSCSQMQREDAASPGVGIAASKRLLQYLQNICLHPDNPKYRKLRTGNRIFFESIYSTGARGVLLVVVD